MKWSESGRRAKVFAKKNRRKDRDQTEYRRDWSEKDRHTNRRIVRERPKDRRETVERSAILALWAAFVRDKFNLRDVSVVSIVVELPQILRTVVERDVAHVDSVFVHDIQEEAHLLVFGNWDLREERMEKQMGRWLVENYWWQKRVPLEGQSKDQTVTHSCSPFPLRRNKVRSIVSRWRACRCWLNG